MASDPRTGPAPRTSVWLEDRPASRRRTPARGRADGARDAAPGGPGGPDQVSGPDQPGGLDRGRITEAAVRLLDAEGLAKFSMRRLAGELGVTAMSVYWYVDGKDDVLELAMDAVAGEIELPDPADTDTPWQDQLRRLATSYRAMFDRHPWLSRLMGGYLNIGPRAMEFAEAARRVTRRTGLPEPLLAGAMAALFQFVIGFAGVEANWNSRRAETGLTPDEFAGAVHAKVRDRPEYAHSLLVTAAPGEGGVEELRDRDFAVALDCVIAGIEAMRPGPNGT
ncbi:TetR/AcrR family transcriptional regulator C-terminal domain-containing protein [Streptomyces phytohabitans]|uniref:TetR/AcrR family transcriptional regulator C-terminal domain-containing protein n=1 Tax=Streptomyces phytohabitans TaxID=1150371 RepID=UPI00345B520A